MGHLEIIFGPMYAEKTTELYGRYNKMMAVCKDPSDVLVINSSIDTRSTPHTIETHTNMKSPALMTISLLDLCNTSEYLKAKYILVDEAQFFTDLIDFTLQAIFHHNKHLIVSGLICDSNQVKFGKLMDLFPHADKITMKKALCVYCVGYHPAIYTVKTEVLGMQETDESTYEQINIGGANKYVSVCRNHMNQ
jgi:thymidine kinase